MYVNDSTISIIVSIKLINDNNNNRFFFPSKMCENGGATNFSHWTVKFQSASDYISK